MGQKSMNKGALALLIHGGAQNWSPERWKSRFDGVCGDRRVLLLPDPALDPAAEEEILQQLKEIEQGRTCLVIAHHLTSVADADEILVMEAGHVIERGTHAALLDAGGTYAQMWLLQQQERAAAIA